MPIERRQLYILTQAQKRDLAASPAFDDIMNDAAIGLFQAQAYHDWLTGAGEDKLNLIRASVEGMAEDPALLTLEEVCAGIHNAMNDYIATLQGTQ